MIPPDSRALRCAVIGAGIAGMACADRLSREAEVVVFESSDQPGGHTDTHEVTVDGTRVAIDSGFIVFNHLNYPGFAGWLDRLGVRSHASDMSFSVTDRSAGIEYGTHKLAALFCQPGNLLRPGHWRMLRDILRFHDLATAVKASESAMGVGAWCRSRRLSDEFLHRHLLPMCAALWSQSLSASEGIAVGQVVAFMRNHRMLQVYDRPEWRVVSGGSRKYVQAFVSSFNGTLACGSTVRAVRERAGRVELLVDARWLAFDAVVLACHSDQALDLIEAPTPAETSILGNVRYASNRVVVHTDPVVMPRSRLAWSSWNATTGIDPGLPCSVTYWMNLLQGVRTPRPVFVTLNPDATIDSSRVLVERSYTHPQFDAAALAAQRRLAELDGQAHRYFAGAWQGFGFHEDGFMSGVRAAEQLLARETGFQSMGTSSQLSPQVARIGTGT